jgi:hypothetical protein
MNVCICVEDADSPSIRASRPSRGTTDCELHSTVTHEIHRLLRKAHLSLVAVDLLRQRSLITDIIHLIVRNRDHKAGVQVKMCTVGTFASSGIIFEGPIFRQLGDAEMLEVVPRL